MAYKLPGTVGFGYFGGNPMKKFLLLTLALYADEDGLNAFPSVETLASVMECSERTVRNKLRELESEGLIVRTETERWKGLRADSRPNPYQIELSQIPEVKPRDVRKHLQVLAERDSTEDERGAGDAPRGGQEVPPTRSMYSINTSTSVVPLTTSSEEDEVERDSGGRDEGEGTTTTFTEESSAENEKLEESDSQPASTPVTAPPAAVAESISAAAPQNLEGIRNPDKTAGWEPSPSYVQEAKRAAPDVRPDLLVSEYVHWCYIKGMQKSDDHWMKWVYRKQRELDEKKMLHMLEKDREQRVEKPWYEKELRF